jgi:hypothetical protein
LNYIKSNPSISNFEQRKKKKKQYNSFITIFPPPHHLRPQPQRVPRERAGTSDVAQSEEQEYDTLQTDTTTCVRRCAVAEGLHVVLESGRIRVDAKGFHAFTQELSVVDTLRAGEDLFSAHEEI